MRIKARKTDRPFDGRKGFHQSVTSDARGRTKSAWGEIETENIYLFPHRRRRRHRLGCHCPGCFSNFLSFLLLLLLGYRFPVPSGECLSPEIHIPMCSAAGEDYSSKIDLVSNFFFIFYLITSTRLGSSHSCAC